MKELLLVQIILLLKEKIKKRIILWKVSLIIQLLLVVFLVYAPFSAFIHTLRLFLSGSEDCGFRLDMGRKAYSKLSVSQAPQWEEHDVDSFFLFFLEEEIFIHWSCFKTF